MEKISLLIIAVLAGPASASLTGQPAESRWNLLDILPHKPKQAAGVANPEQRSTPPIRRRMKVKTSAPFCCTGFSSTSVP